MNQNKTVHEKFNQLRKQAEDLIKNKELIKETLEFEDPLKLIHELQTFQIELELQNEELHRSQQDLMESQVNYTQLYDFSPTGYISLGFKGNGSSCQPDLCRYAVNTEKSVDKQAVIRSYRF